jgi:NAD(P)-dependent dehydrogenase (short-subunit alcohol dehydrogenase family)
MIGFNVRAEACTLQKLHLIGASFTNFGEQERWKMHDGKTGFARYASLEGRVVLVSGGATGIGESIVSHFARQGARVAFLDVQDEAGLKLAEGLAAEGCPKPLYLHCDLVDLDALKGAVDRVLAECGTVDVLVNNAANDQRHAVEEVTPAMWDQLMAINLRAQFFLMQAVAPGMRAARRGSIVNLSSIAWIIPNTNMPVYVAAKAAIVGLTRTMAHELGGDNIRVNAVLPGAIVTERQKRLWYTPELEAMIMDRQALKRSLVPEDVARLILFLAADDSSAITNQSYMIDGGWV